MALTRRAKDAPAEASNVLPAVRHDSEGGGDAAVRGAAVRCLTCITEGSSPIRSRLVALPRGTTHGRSVRPCRRCYGAASRHEPCRRPTQQAGAAAVLGQGDSPSCRSPLHRHRDPRLRAPPRARGAVAYGVGQYVHTGTLLYWALVAVPAGMTSVTFARIPLWADGAVLSPIATVAPMLGGEVLRFGLFLDALIVGTGAHFGALARTARPAANAAVSAAD